MDDYNLFGNNYSYDDEDKKPERNEPLIHLYDRLCALIASLPPDITSTTLRDGTGERYNGYIDQLISMTDDQTLSDFKVQIHTNTNRPYVMGNDYVRQITGITSYLHKVNEVIGWYCGSAPSVNFGKASRGASSPTTVNNHVHSSQENTQTQSVQIEFTQTIINMTESLTRYEAEHPDIESKENMFASTLKKNLPMAKDALGIIATTLKIAGDLGIDPHTALKALGLS